MASPLPPTRWEGPIEVLTAAGAVAGTSHARFWRRDDSALGTTWGGIIEGLPDALPLPSAEPVTVRLRASGRTGTIMPLEQPAQPSHPAGDHAWRSRRRIEGVGPPPFES